MFTGHHVSIKLHWTGLAWPGLVWAGLDWISLDNYIKIYTGSSPARVPSNVTMLSLLLELASGDVTRGHQAKCKSHWPTLNVPCPVSYLHGYFSSFSKCFPPAPFHMETLKHIQHVQGNFHNDIAGCWDASVCVKFSHIPQFHFLMLCPCLHSSSFIYAPFSWPDGNIFL